ncbi:MAG: 50S ribosome-binding GTPase [Methylococcales bacterium]|nr:50S ribosome-binding GTPase [Methylococcales bacterium]
MSQQHFTDELFDAVTNDPTLSDTAKAEARRNLDKLKKTKVNILITGATGCGKSSTINALFGYDKAKVGQSVNPETMDISKHELNNIVLYDSPGLGDGKAADIRHSKNIIDKLYEKTSNGDMLIDLVLVILEGGSRDLGTSFELINSVIIPNLGEDKKRLLVAINQADMAMKGRGWNHAENKPEPELVEFLEEKVLSSHRRIKEATGVFVEPIYYVAGYKDGNNSQNPYNLSKLLCYILLHTKEEKRAVFVQDVNQDEDVWRADDGLDKYREKIRSTFLDSVKAVAGEVVGAVADRFISTVSTMGRAAGAVLGGAARVIGNAASSVLGFFGL